MYPAALTSNGMSPALDLARTPFIVIWELTQACDLACVHCRASARPQRSPLELSTAEGEDLIRQVRNMGAPVFVLTGGDPLQRPDLFHLVEYGTRLGVRVSLTPSTTPLLTRDALAGLKARGLARLAISIDGADAASHDRFRGVPGAFDRALATVGWAHEVGLPVQINTTMSRHNAHDFDALAALMESLDIVLWSVFFLIPVGRATLRDGLGGEAIELLFEKLYALSLRARFDVKTTEAMHYRRYVAQQRKLTGASRPADRRHPDGIGRAPRGLNDGKGFVFISHLGEVYPSGFMPRSAGNIRREPLAGIYANSPLFVALRDSSRLGGKCGACEFREICGGSRARALAYTGDPLAADPACIYEPAGWVEGAA